jgi:DNA-directed RNA polymerase specialized sigma24 family protein
MEHEFTVESTYAAIDLHLAKLPERLQRDREDLRQDILLAVMERAVEFNPSLASWATFQTRLITAFLENHLMSQRWSKNQSPESMEEIAENEPQRIPKTNDVHSWEIGLHENAVFAGEVQAIIDTMPKRLRNCAECLKHYSPAETADMMGIPLNILQYDIRKIKRIFMKANITPNQF